ncbi:MAG: rhomboid family intramembrane serine protease, partial [Spirochaetia bacterium]|nr:rhomboid family intramembrane serine protease [Spirochaetia bacterium]
MQDRWTIQQAQPVTDSVYRLLLVFVTAFVVEKTTGILTGITPVTLALHFGPDFHPSQILTHFLVTLMGGPGSILHILFYCIMLWSFGTELERLWGSYNFLKFFFIGTAGGAAFSAVVSLALPGFFISGFGAG